MRRISICLLENTGLAVLRQAGNEKDKKCHVSQIRTEKTQTVKRIEKERGFHDPN